MEEYEGVGTFYLAQTMTGQKGLVSMAYSEYEKLLAMGLMDQEVEATLTKKNIGSEYPDGAPSWHGKAGLYSIKIDGTNLKPQMDIAEDKIIELIERGLKDGDEVLISVSALPYAQPRTADYDDLDLASTTKLNEFFPEGTIPDAEELS